MAVPHFSVSIVARGSGRSAVLSAAYRHCAKMEYEREARTIDYTRKQGLLHEEFVIPADAPDWLRAMIADRSVTEVSEAFWNKVEDFEKRSDAQLAKDVTIALPVELSSAQNIALVQDFVERHITSKGMVADWVYHDAPGNPHVHLMTTLRPLTEDGFGAKKVAVLAPDCNPMRNDSGKIVYELWAGSGDDFNAFRDGWFACQNRHLALAGLDIRIDGRSFEKQGIELTPTIHLGVGTKAIDRKAEQASAKAPAWSPKLERIELQEDRRAENACRIQRRPEIVLDLITREKSVFDEGGTRSLGNGRLSCRWWRAGGQGGRGPGEGSGCRLAHAFILGAALEPGPEPARRQDRLRSLDEAGMVSSRQMALIVEAVTKAGAKLVLVGDPEQLQPIEAGAAFRAIADRIGYAELDTIYRQRDQWMRDASLDLGPRANHQGGRCLSLPRQADGFGPEGAG